MDAIVSRWEWRTFAQEIETPVALARFWRIRRAESAETHLFTGTSVDNPKIRNHTIDVKHLLQIDAAGLEQWAPVLKAAFPLTVDELTPVFRALGLDAPPAPGGCDLKRFLQIVEDNDRIHAASVHKVRDLFDVKGCAVEASAVTVEGEAFRTLAVESPDPVKVREAVASLGLWGRENVSYVKAMQRIEAGRRLV